MNFVPSAASKWEYTAHMRVLLCMDCGSLGWRSIICAGAVVVVLPLVVCELCSIISDMHELNAF